MSILYSNIYIFLIILHIEEHIYKSHHVQSDHVFFNLIFYVLPIILSSYLCVNYLYAFILTYLLKNIHII